MDNKEIGRRVKKSVKESGMTQEEVADRSDMSKSHLHKMKIGATKSTLSALSRVGRVVGRSLGWYLKKEKK